MDCLLAPSCTSAVTWYQATMYCVWSVDHWYCIILCTLQALCYSLWLQL